MDLNYLFYRQQVERLTAEAASSDAARKIHGELAREYENQINRLTDGRISFPALLHECRA
jgi:hypothetical protein